MFESSLTPCTPYINNSAGPLVYPSNSINLTNPPPIINRINVVVEDLGQGRLQFFYTVLTNAIYQGNTLALVTVIYTYIGSQLQSVVIQPFINQDITYGITNNVLTIEIGKNLIAMANRFSGLITVAGDKYIAQLVNCQGNQDPSNPNSVQVTLTRAKKVGLSFGGSANF